MAQTPSWKGPLFLATLLAVGGTSVYWLEFKHRPKKEENEETQKHIFSLKNRAVFSIKIAGGDKVFNFKCGDDPVKFCKAGDSSKWELTEPQKIRADDTNVNSLLSAIEGLSVTDTIDLSKETPEKRKQLLTEYQLGSDRLAKPGMMRVEVQPVTGPVQTAYFGDKHPMSDTIFALAAQAGTLKEDRVLLIPSYFKSNFEKDLTHWRNKKILTLAQTEIGSFELSGPNGKVSGVRQEGLWTLNGQIPGDIENIDSLLTAVSYLNAEKFAAENKASPAGKSILSGARAFYTLVLKPEKLEQTPVTLTLFEKTKPNVALYATVSNLDPVYEMNGGVRNRISKTLQDLRLTKLVTSIERFTLKHLVLSGAQHTAPLTLISKDGRWADEQGREKIASDRIQTFLDRISGNRIKEFISLEKAPGGADKGLQVILGDDKIREKRKLVFWKAGEKLLGRDLLSDRKEAWVIDSSISNALPWSLEAPGKSP